MPSRLIDEYKKRIDTYNEDKLKFLQTRTAIGFRSYFNLMASISKPELKRLNTSELRELREYINHKINLVAGATPDSDKSTSSESNSDYLVEDAYDSSGEYVPISIQIERQAQEAYRHLNILEKNCNDLGTDTLDSEDLVSELQEFIETAREIIEDASEEPEITFKGLDEERLRDLQQITERIKSNDKMIVPILKAERELPKKLKKSKEDTSTTKASDFENLTDKDSDADSEEELRVIRKH